MNGTVEMAAPRRLILPKRLPNRDGGIWCCTRTYVCQTFKKSVQRCVSLVNLKEKIAVGRTSIREK